jgi:hypothetical protein
MTSTPDPAGDKIAGQLGLLPDELTPAALEDARAAATAELERLDLAAMQARGEALAAVARWTAARKDAGDQLDDAVATARGLGATWQQVADAAGVRLQSAWERWKR